MSHVDEGTLHAYLDGELPSGERAALESHLAQCASCRAQLAEERALLERATALLGSTRPAERAVPPFEQVRRAPRRPWHMRTGFAWAASLVLAVGFGYYVSGALQRRPQPEAQPLATTQQNRPADKAAASEGLRRRKQDSGTIASVTPPPDANPRSAAPLPLDTVLRIGDTARPHEEAGVTAAPAAGAASRLAAAPSAQRADTRSAENLVSTAWPVISRGKAASLLGDRPVGVPGLATRGIRSSPTGDGTIVVEQALDSKTVIQIFQRPASSAQVDELGARERADRVLARYVGRLRVEISGPVSTDSLNKLLELVEPLP
jgi:hypothetical protein